MKLAFGKLDATVFVLRTTKPTGHPPSRKCLRRKATPRAFDDRLGAGSHMVGPTRSAPCSAASGAVAEVAEKENCIAPDVYEGFWEWKGFSIRYQRSGSSGPALVLVHGFGGNCDHWRKNIPVLGKTCSVYSVDLLGYGYSDKPDPREYSRSSLYTYDTWAGQLLDFIDGIVKRPAFLICNSIGGIAGLQAAVKDPSSVKGVQLLDISLRQLHVRNQSPLAKPFVKAFQNILVETFVGDWFFSQVAQPSTVKQILQKAYCDADAVSDELVDIILKPGLLPGASSVFLEFISYSTGPLPHDLLSAVNIPVSILWGAEDPWEKVEWGREFKQYPCVEEFIELAGVGHCPHDEAPHLVNPLIEKFVFRHT